MNTHHYFCLVLALGLGLAGCSKKEGGETEASSSPRAATPTNPAPIPPAAAVETKPPVPAAPSLPAPSTAQVAVLPSVPATTQAVVAATPADTGTLTPGIPTAATQKAASNAVSQASGTTNKADTGAAVTSKPTTNETALTTASSSGDQLTLGLKAALSQGLQQAIARLGKDGGFLTNAAVKILMPDSLRPVEKILRNLKQDALVDQFVATMNHAAEQAVPATAEVFSTALKQMTIDDAKSILVGTNNAATQFFRRTTESQLRDKFTPIVKDATAKVGLTAAYKQLTDRVRLASPFLNLESLDLDSYVTTKTLDGLFTMVAQEEQRIRENPAARTTELLQSVFGRLRK